MYLGLNLIKIVMFTENPYGEFRGKLNLLHSLKLTLNKKKLQNETEVQQVVYKLMK